MKCPDCRTEMVYETTQEGIPAYSCPDCGFYDIAPEENCD
jgi:predicted RNA-binding Zn-ribbon protein involved in translation (DUF1610 family)